MIYIIVDHDKLEKEQTDRLKSEGSISGKKPMDGSSQKIISFEKEVPAEFKDVKQYTLDEIKVEVRKETWVNKYFVDLFHYLSASPQTREILKLTRPVKNG